MVLGKYISLFIFLLITTLSCGQDIIVVNGNIPIVMSAPHGGDNVSLSIKNRKSGVLTKDDYTIELLQLISNEINRLYKKQVYIVYTNRSRKEIDLNRNVKDAFDDIKMQNLYYQYHHDLQGQLLQNIWSDSVILYIDIHGQGHAHKMLEIGFDKKDSELLPEDYLLGDMFQKQNIKCYPATNINRPSPYFNGGYCIETYKKYPSVKAVQLEIPSQFRKNLKQRKEFAKKTAVIIMDYYKVLQKEKL